MLRANRAQPQLDRKSALIHLVVKVCAQSTAIGVSAASGGTVGGEIAGISVALASNIHAFADLRRTHPRYAAQPEVAQAADAFAEPKV